MTEVKLQLCKRVILFVTSRREYLLPVCLFALSKVSACFPFLSRYVRARVINYSSAQMNTLEPGSVRRLCVRGGKAGSRLTAGNESALLQNTSLNTASSSCGRFVMSLLRGDL